MKILKQQQGFSLVEVVAAIVIIGVVLTSFSQLFIQSNKISVNNNDKLVMINLADAELERIKNEPFPFFTKPSISPINTTKSKTISLNKQEYIITIKAFQNTEEFKMKIFNVLITVSPTNSNSKSQIEGYVVYD